MVGREAWFMCVDDQSPTQPPEERETPSHKHKQQSGEIHGPYLPPPRGSAELHQTGSPSAETSQIEAPQSEHPPTEPAPIEPSRPEPPLTEPFDFPPSTALSASASTVLLRRHDEAFAQPLAITASGPPQLPLPESSSPFSSSPRETRTSLSTISEFSTQLDKLFNPSVGLNLDGFSVARGKDNLVSALARNIVIVGDPLVIKTQLFNRFAEDTFSTSWTSWTSRLSQQRTDQISVSLRGQYMSLRTIESTDTDDLKHEKTALYGLYSDPFVVLICFAVNDLDTLENVVTHWFPEITKHCPNIPCLLVGNMVDLYSDDIDSKFRKASPSLQVDARAEGIAQVINAKRYFPCSAKTGSGVMELFEFATELAVDQRRQYGRLKRRSISQLLRRR